MAESEPEEGSSGILGKVVKISEWLLDSNETANILIIVLIMLVILPILGIGITLTHAAAPLNQVEIGNN